jgi:molybdenum cofactor biosynthesis enzyme MoaA
MNLANLALGILRSKFTNCPFYIRLHVTHRCNYRCKMCGQHRRLADHPKELSLEEMRLVARRVAAIGARHLVITGGEPFLRRDLPAIIAVFKQHHFSIRVQTNGGPQITPEVLAACARAG